MRPMRARLVAAAMLLPSLSCLVTIDRSRIGGGTDASSEAPPVSVPTVIGSSRSQSDGSNPLVLSVPAGTKPEDVLVAVVTATTDQVISEPSTWSRLRVDQNVSGATLRSAIYVHVAQNGDLASYAWAPSNAGASVGGIVTIRGANGTNPIEAHDGLYTGDAQTFSTPKLSVSGPALLLAVFSSNGGRGFTVDAPFVNVFEEVKPVGCEVQVARLAWTAAGSTLAATTKSTLDPNSSNIGQLVAVRP